MRLDVSARDDAWAEVRTTVAGALDRRAERGAAAPILVAFSGGGDSLALLLAAKAWADRAGRRLEAVTVDHRLRPAGADWARWCAARVARLGVAHRSLVWEGDKPASGIAAAARDARHRLIAKAARDAGAAVVLMGHTADDRAEGAWMRAAGVRVGDPREWSPSPAWPDGRGVFLLRPLLSVRRATIRTALSALGETWIDDPANEDLAQRRARARQAIGGGGPALSDAVEAPCDLYHLVVEGRAGDLTIDAAALAAAPAAAARAFTAAALLCAAGTTWPPRRDRLDRLMSDIRASAPFVATLAGARVEGDRTEVRFMRDAGEFARRGAPGQALALGRPVVFDGRFEITARRAGLNVGPLRGRLAALSKAERSALRATPPAARAAAPALTSLQGTVRLALFANRAEAEVRSLVADRLAAALNVIKCESAAARVAKLAMAS